MPLIAHNALPSFQRLREEGQAVLHPNRAARQDIRGLHVGLLNMMPDAALEATERQFFRLVGASNPIAQFYVHPFTLPELPRGETARAHIARYYEDFDQLSEQGLDALIITGANATSNELSEQAFWDPLKRVMAWAEDRVTSTLCSCLATHAVMEFRYGHKRVRQEDKRWGVFSHQVVDQHTYICLVTPQDNRREVASSHARGVDAANDSLTCGLFVTGGPIDLAGEKEVRPFVEGQ